MYQVAKLLRQLFPALCPFFQSVHGKVHAMEPHLSAKLGCVRGKFVLSVCHLAFEIVFGKFASLQQQDKGPRVHGWGPRDALAQCIQIGHFWDGCPFKIPVQFQLWNSQCLQTRVGSQLVLVHEFPDAELATLAHLHTHTPQNLSGSRFAFHSRRLFLFLARDSGVDPLTHRSRTLACSVCGLILPVSMCMIVVGSIFSIDPI